MNAIKSNTAVIIGSGGGIGKALKNDRLPYEKEVLRQIN